MSTTIPQAASKSRARATCLRIAAASLAVFLFAGCRPEPTTAVDRPLAADELARVGPAVISVEAFLAERGRTSSSEPDAVLLERLIQRELLYAEARRVAFDQSSKLQAAWKNLVIQRFQEELENQAEAQPVVTAAELDGEYAQHPERYSLPAQARVALLQLAAGTAGGRAEEVQAEGLRTAKTTLDFGPLAADSIHPSSRRQGGDLGWVTRAQARLALPPEVVAALFALRQPGEVSPMISTGEGLFLLKLIEARPARLKPFEAVRDQVAYELQRQRRAAAEQLLYTRLRTHHSVQTQPQLLTGLPSTSPTVATHPPRLPSR